MDDNFIEQLYPLLDSVKSLHGILRPVYEIAAIQCVSEILRSLMMHRGIPLLTVLSLSGSFPLKSRQGVSIMLKNGLRHDVQFKH